MKHRRTIVLSITLALLVAGLPFAGCTRARDPWAEVEGKGPKVLVSFPPLYCFTKSVAGDHARVLSLLTTVGPHDHRPDVTDALKAKKADIFIYNGLGLDDYATPLRAMSGNKKFKAINVGEILEEDHHDLMVHVHHDHDHGNGHHHHHGDHDPHVWLGIEPARETVKIIRDKLSEAAPEYKDHYHQNAEKFLKELDDLHEYGKKQFKDKKGRIITTHDSMAYFENSFELDVVDHLMPQPGVEADSKKLAELIKLCTDEKNPVRAITVEPQYSDKAAKVLINQIRNKVKSPDHVPQLVIFDTLETADPGFTADYYLVKMRENIDNLAKALK